MRIRRRFVGKAGFGERGVEPGHIGQGVMRAFDQGEYSLARALFQAVLKYRSVAPLLDLVIDGDERRFDVALVLRF